MLWIAFALLVRGVLLVARQGHTLRGKGNDRRFQAPELRPAALPRTDNLALARLCLK